MPNERISMSKLKQLIGLQTSNLSVREFARALGLSIGALSKYQRAVRAVGIFRLVLISRLTLLKHSLRR
jgi:transcriptional regulator with XRE-family HTH domain